MSRNTLPLVLSPTDLVQSLPAGVEQASSVRLIDLRPRELFEKGHIPGASLGDVSLLNRSEKPIGGLMPDVESVNTFLRQAGVQPDEHIVVYDDGLQTSAARAIWVLDAHGITASSWLNGGFRSWVLEQLPVSTSSQATVPGSLTTTFTGGNNISVDALMPLLDSPKLSILDVRTIGEFEGSDVRSAFGGHVPGAAHLEWTRLLDENGKLLSDDELKAQLSELGVAADGTVIVYCQTHQRSALTYVALRHLGFKDIKAIDGAWSNWGNREDTPKE